MTGQEATNAGESSENPCSSEIKEDDATKIELPPSSSAELSENQVSSSSQSTSSEVVGERTAGSISLNAEEQILEPKELPEDENQDFIGSRNDQTDNLNGGSEEIILAEGSESATVVLKNSAAQDKTTRDNEVKGDSRHSEDSSMIENKNKAIDESKKLTQLDVSTTDKTKDSETAAVNQNTEESHRVAEGESALNETKGAKATTQQVIDKAVKASEMYPKLNSVASEAGTVYIAVSLWHLIQTIIRNFPHKFLSSPHKGVLLAVDSPPSPLHSLSMTFGIVILQMKDSCSANLTFRAHN